MVFLLIKTPELDDEETSTNEGKGTHNTVVPDQQRIISKDDQRLLDSGSNGSGEESNSLDERSHVSWRLGESVLERSDGSENLGETDQDVGSGLGPDVDVSWEWVVVLVNAAVGLVSTWRLLVDVDLDDHGPHHGGGTDPEPDKDLLDRGEVIAALAKGWIEEGVANRNHDDKGEWVEVVQHIGWETVKLHGGGLGGQVTNGLVVGQPPKWVPSEDGASGETSADFINPGVIERVPYWALVVWSVGWLDGIPEGTVVHVLPGAEWVDGPSALASAEEELDGLGYNRPLWWRLAVTSASPPHDGWTNEEDEGWQGEGQPETDILLSVDHAELADQSTDVDEHVEVVVNARLGDRWVDNDTLAGLESLDDQSLNWNLLDNEWRNVWLETTGSETHNDDTEDEGTHGSIWLGDNWWDGRDDQDDVTNNGDADRDTNGLVTTPVLISHIGREEWNGVNPERVEGVDGGSDSWSLSKSTGDTLLGRTSGTSSWIGACKGTRWKWLVHVVGD